MFRKYIQEIDSGIPFSGVSSPSANTDAENAVVGLGFVAGLVAPGGEESFVERQIGTAANKIENIAGKLTEETLEGANREVNGGMKVAKAGGGLFDHVGKVEQAINGLNRQAKHLESMLQRSGLSESHVNRINGLIERARGLLEAAQQAITKDPI